MTEYRTEHDSMGEMQVPAEALYTRPEARRLGEGSGDELKEREAAVLLDPAARVDADGVLSAGVAAEVSGTAERSGR